VRKTRIDALGRVLIPAEMRRNHGISIKDEVEIFSENNVIVLRKYEAACIFCGSLDDVNPFREKLVCLKCAEEIRKN
jgi:transcriptional pleiotropic regulator of transition state genes